MGAFRDFFNKLFGGISGIKDWLDEKRDEVTTYFDAVRVWTENSQISFWIGWMQNVKCVEALDNVYGTIPPWIKQNEAVKQYYNTRKQELSAEGMDKISDVGLGLFGSGVKKGIDAITKAAIANLVPIFEEIQTTPPEDLDVRDILNRTAKSGEFGVNAVVAFMLGHFLSPILSTSMAPIWEFMAQQVWKTMPVRLLNDRICLDLIHRYPDSKDELVNQLRLAGLSDTNIKWMLEQYKFVPGATDLVRFGVREVYSPEIAEKFGQYEDFPEEVMSDAYRIGFPREEMMKFWAAHWNLPSAEVGFDLLHRGIIDYETLKILLKALDVMPYWRDKFIELSWNLPTRVDLRRMWDMRTIDEARLREVYTGLGYHGKDLDDYVLWTKVYTDFPSLIDRYKNGWITLADVKTEMLADGMPPDRLETMLQEIVKKESGARTVTEKNLTKAEIVKGVKTEVISLDQGIELLMDLGYEEWEAEYILVISLGVAAGSPESFWEFKKITEAAKTAMGKKGKRVPQELIEAEKKYREHPEDPKLEVAYREEMKKWEEQE